MAFKSKFAGSIALAALVVVSASPANARGYPYRWHRHNDGVGAGAVIGAILGVGLIAAIASSASRDRAANDRRYEDRPYDPQDNPRADERGFEDRDYDARTGNDRDYETSQAGNANEDTAVDACALAARDEASHSGGFAEVQRITGAEPYGGNGGWNVTGTVDQRSSFSARDSHERSFRCIWDGGRVSSVTFGQSV